MDNTSLDMPDVLNSYLLHFAAHLYKYLLIYIKLTDKYQCNYEM